jgi:hypothetical protein
MRICERLRESACGGEPLCGVQLNYTLKYGSNADSHIRCGCILKGYIGVKQDCIYNNAWRVVVSMHCMPVCATTNN